MTNICIAEFFICSYCPPILQLLPANNAKTTGGERVPVAFIF